MGDRLYSLHFLYIGNFLEINSKKETSNNCLLIINSKIWESKRENHKQTIVQANLKDKVTACIWLQAGMRVLTRVSDEVTKAGTMGTTVEAGAKTADEVQGETTGPHQHSFWLSTDIPSVLLTASNWGQGPRHLYHRQESS